MIIEKSNLRNHLISTCNEAIEKTEEYISWFKSDKPIEVIIVSEKSKTDFIQILEGMVSEIKNLLHESDITLTDEYFSAKVLPMYETKFKSITEERDNLMKKFKVIMYIADEFRDIDFSNLSEKEIEDKGFIKSVPVKLNSKFDINKALNDCNKVCECSNRKLVAIFTEGFDCETISYFYSV